MSVTLLLSRFTSSLLSALILPVSFLKTNYDIILNYVIINGHTIIKMIICLPEMTVQVLVVHLPLAAV